MERRQATYTSATRMTDMILMLARSWAPVPLHDLCSEICISDRTARRYRSALNQYFREKISPHDKSFSFIQTATESGQEKWFLVQPDEQFETNSLRRLTSVYVSLVLLKTLDSSVLEEGMRDLWKTALGQVQSSKKGKLALLDRKFRCTGFGKKSYTKNNAVLAQIINALIGQKKLQLLHSGAREKKPRYHIAHPYTLLMHRDALYLHAYAESRKDVRIVGVDRVRDAITLPDTFKYPAGFDSDKLTQGSFGIFEETEAKPFTVVVAFNECLHEYITTRQWHPKQKFSPIQNGRFTMQAPLTNILEFIPWVLQFGSDAEVLEPASVSDQVIKMLADNLEQYFGKSRL